MNIYQRKFRWKVILLILALIIAGFTLWYTNNIAEKIAIEEHKKMNDWAESQALSLQIDEEDIGSPFILNIVRNNNTIPTIWTSKNDEIKSSRNFDSLKVARGWDKNDTIRREKDNAFLMQELAEMKKSGKLIPMKYEIDLGNGETITFDERVYYKDSILLSQLKYYPFIQLATIGIFLLLSYLAFSAARRSEQNQVWVGMAKETAHQLGTPLSSLIGWIEIIKANEEAAGNNENIGIELEKDLDRLKLITDRFSKIGSQPKLTKVSLYEEIKTTVDYIKRRASAKIKFELLHNISSEAHLSPPLFDWVVENILKNALDAMQSSGEIIVTLSENSSSHLVDIFNSGEPLPKSKWKTIFKPGYSTKKRGWGLGLSLSKRIIEKYHKGKIFVKNSESKVGTTFRIVLPKLLNN